MLFIRKRLKGQAMTEFTIASAAILIPLFLAFPFLAKIGDIRHAAIQAARYEAWEYTVWNATDPSRGSSLSPARSYLDRANGQTLPVRSRAESRRGADQRFFSDHFSIAQGVQGGSNSADGKGFWATEDGTPLYQAGVRDLSSYGDPSACSGQTYCDSSTPEPTGFLAVLFDFADAVAGFIQGSTPLDPFSKLNGDGFHRSRVVLPLVYPTNPMLVPTDESGNAIPIDLVVRAQAGVLSDSWSASSVVDARTQVRGLVPTSLLGNSIGEPLQGLAGALAYPFGSPLLGTGRSGNFSFNVFDPGYRPYLEFGYVDFDAVHPDWVDGDDRSLECEAPGEAGVCRFR